MHFFKKTEVLVSCNTVLVTGYNKVIHIYIYIYIYMYSEYNTFLYIILSIYAYSFRFFFFIDYYKILSIVPCAI